MGSSFEGTGTSNDAATEGYPDIEVPLLLVTFRLICEVIILGSSACSKREDFPLFVGSLEFGFLNGVDLESLLMDSCFLRESRGSSEFLGFGGTSITSCFTLGTFELLKEIDFKSGPAETLLIIIFSNSSS